MKDNAGWKPRGCSVCRFFTQPLSSLPPIYAILVMVFGVLKQGMENEIR